MDTLEIRSLPMFKEPSFLMRCPKMCRHNYMTLSCQSDSLDKIGTGITKTRKQVDREMKGKFLEWSSLLDGDVMTLYDKAIRGRKVLGASGCEWPSNLLVFPSICIHIHKGL